MRHTIELESPLSIQNVYAIIDAIAHDWINSSPTLEQCNYDAERYTKRAHRGLYYSVKHHEDNITIVSIDTDMPIKDILKSIGQYSGITIKRVKSENL